MSERFSNERYYTEGFRGNFKKYNQIGERIEEILTETIGDVFISRHGEEVGERLLKKSYRQANQGFSSVSSDAVLLRDQHSDAIVGFSYASPAEPITMAPLRPTPYHAEQKKTGMSSSEYNELQQHTAEVGWTAILGEHQGNGGWSLMMDSLEARLRGRGYEYMSRFVRVDNEYAKKVKQRLGEKVVYEKAFVDSDYLGKQVYMRAKLK